MRPRPTGQPNRAWWLLWATAAVAGCGGWLLSQRAEIHGESMYPALVPGDRALFLPALVMGRPRVGDVVVLSDPRLSSRRITKRISGIGPGGLELRGDNPAASTDSRHFGPVPPKALIGVLYYRYHPAWNRGVIPRGQHQKNGAFWALRRLVFTKVSEGYEP